MLALVELAALQLTYLPDTPATYCHPGRTQQQGQRCQATAGALGRWGGDRFRRRLCRRLIIIGQDSLAHVSILCMGAHRVQLSALRGRCSAALHGYQQGRGTGATAIHNLLGPGGPGLFGNPWAGHEQRQACQLRPIRAGQLLQMFKTLPTADHQAIEAFRFDAALQGARRVIRQAATIQFQIFDTSTLLCKTLCQQFATSDAAHDQDTRCRHGNGLKQGR